MQIKKEREPEAIRDTRAFVCFVSFVLVEV